jgi:hypothetical protein
MKLLDVLNEATEDSIIQRGRIIYKTFRKGSIEDTIYNKQGKMIVVTIKYELPEEFDVDVYENHNGFFPIVKFWDWINWDAPIDEDNSYHQPEVWIEKVMNKFWYSHNVILVDENFGEDLEDRDYLTPYFEDDY